MKLLGAQNRAEIARSRGLRKLGVNETDYQQGLAGWDRAARGRTRLRV